MKAWMQFLKHQERELGQNAVDKWLRSLKVVDFDACNLYLEAKDAFQVMWFEEHVRKKIKKGLLNNNKKEIKVHISTQNEARSRSVKEKEVKAVANAPQTATFAIAFDDLDPFANFDQFVESNSTVLAYKLLCKITNYDPISKTIIASDGDLAAFNPIYLFGHEGTGKTHLLMATAHALKARNLKVIYAKAETFTEHVVKAIRSGEMGMFRQAYRNIDVLLIDDVQVFSRKWATQEELFHTFNTLHLAGKQIILAANCSPAQLQHVEPRLISRFEWGITLPLEHLGEKEAAKVLRKKAQVLETTLHPSVEQFLLATFKNSTKSLVRALETLILRRHLKNARSNQSLPSISVQNCKHELKDLIEIEQNQALTSDKIVNHVAHYFGIKRDDILGKGQTRKCVIPRQISMYLCRMKLKMPFKKIAQVFCKDHSTVMSSVKLIESNLENDKKEISTPYFSILSEMNR